MSIYNVSVLGNGGSGWHDQSLIDLAPLSLDVVKTLTGSQTPLRQQNRSLIKVDKTPSCNGRRKFKTFISSHHSLFCPTMFSALSMPQVSVLQGLMMVVGKGSGTWANPDLSVILEHKISYRQNPLELSTNIS